MPAWEPVSEIARPPRSTIAIATSAQEMRSPTESSMSISRACGVGETRCASVDQLVGRVAHRRDDARRPCSRAPGGDEALRDALQLVGVADRGAAELHHDEARRAGRVLDRRDCFELGHVICDSVGSPCDPAIGRSGST